MGTSWRVDYYAPPDMEPDNVRRSVDLALQRVVDQMSHWSPDSDLARYNHAPAASWIPLPNEFFHVLRFALSVAEDSTGAFDPAIGRIVDLWGFGPTPPLGAAPPAPQQIDRAARGGKWREIRLDALSREALQPGGAFLDLSAIAKGFSVDLVARNIEKLGLSDYLIEVGGELRGRGIKTDGQPWWVQIESPPTSAATGFPEIRLALCNCSVATSGDYRRYFEHENVRYGHTIDPRTFKPTVHALAAVSVVHADCMAADAYSTAIAVLGPEEGLAFAERLRLAALLAVRTPNGFEARYSSAFARMLE